MLFIEQVFGTSESKNSCIRCPLCEHGRLCDKPIGEKATVIAITTDHQMKTGASIILKCPKCAHKFAIYFSK